MKRRMIGKITVAALLIVLLGAMTNTWAQRNDTFSQLDLLVDVRHELLQEYVKKPNSQKMTEAAVRGMIQSLGDPFTVYFAPDEVSSFEKEVHGKFSGIGAQINMLHGTLHIVTPLEDSPAWNAGIMAGDMVLAINGKATRGMKLDQAVKLLSGDAGTKVTLRVRHESGEVRNVTITRQIINVRTVRGFRRLPNQHYDFMLNDQRKIGYIRISQFTEDTAGQVHDAVQALLKQGVKGLIVDVRFNPGGLLESAVKISSMFLPGGETIVSVKGRVIPEKIYRAKSDDTIPNVPMVIIANEASASAAEILTGALSDNHRALFVGTRTYGKGSVQQVRMLQGDQGAIKITNAYYYLPNGSNINRNPGSDKWGVDPSPGEYVPMTPKQVQAMIKVRQAKDIVSKTNGDAPMPKDVTPQWIDKNLKDPQLAAALKAMFGKLNTGTWPKVGLPHSQELAMASLRGSLVRERNALQEQLDEVDQRLSEIGVNPAATQPVASAKKPGGEASPTGRLEVERAIEKSQGQPVGTGGADVVPHNAPGPGG